MSDLSPMMTQYLQIKSENEDSILFFRVGDFYEMFYEDAEIASEKLDIVLTGKDCGQKERAPMCGVPYHSCEAYIARLVEKGYKVAICEQTQNPAEAKGIVKREIVRIITPGTVIEDSMLEEGRNNYLVAVSFFNNTVGICFTDASTGECFATSIYNENLDISIINELNRFRPKELLISNKTLKNFKELSKYLDEQFTGTVTIRNDDSFSFKNEELLLSHFNIISTENLGFKSGEALSFAVGATFEYLYETGVSGNISVNKIEIYTNDEFMHLDMTAIRNLELLETMRSKSKKGSLLGVLDKTKTAMGKRLLCSWITKPLINISTINNRINAVEELLSNLILRGELIEYLIGIRDIERIMTRIVYGSANAKDLNQIADTIDHFPPLKNLLKSTKCKFLNDIYNSIDTLDDINSIIRSAIKKNPPQTIKEGGIINDGYNEELDQIRCVLNGGTDFIAKIEAREKERTGIKNLRVKYNKVFGYYIEVTNSFLDKVPDDYIRKQTLTNAERFITEELKDIERKVLSAKDRVVQLEYEIFDAIRKTVASELVRLQKTAAAIAKLDVVCSLASISAEYNYCRPLVNKEGKIVIKSGRHPVVEKLSKVPFVANDTYLDTKDNRCALITGPNMAGKSTYMRQIALITLMAQIGCFVPATSAEIGVVDAIYTRVGASDDLASGQSTFMVEMSEVAEILKNATKNSLLILDEIGRGTSTYDGMSMAKSVLEFVVNKIGAKSLFATHYHELTEMENEISGLVNYNVAVKKRGDDITFLRRIIKGAADDSYGIEVAKLSGIPESVIKRAKEILASIENEGIVTYKTETNPTLQLPLEIQSAQEILHELKAIDANTLTPIEALQILYDICKKAENL